MCQGGADICSVRLVFSTFSIAAPVTTTVAETSGVSRTQCRDAQFAVNSDGGWTAEFFITSSKISAATAGPRPPVICGENSGYHMIVTAR